ncbi:MAG: hypothetical protein H6850_00870 [Alphaproteobacteria bacterium]|nr:MAG: hypothetical protein H6850_00870 [Alphaproteobacteria bacterium]
MDILLHSLQQSLVLLPLVLGIYMSYGCAKLTDLTIEGSFVFGAAVYAQSLIFTQSPVLAFCIGTLAGVIPGMLTSAIQIKNRMNSLMAGIITLFMFQSFNIFVLNQPNINLLDFQHCFAETTHLLGLGIVLMIVLTYLDRSVFGLRFKGLGNNSRLFSERYNLDFYKMIVLGLSNMLAALSGILTASVNGYADIYMGQGIALIGIGTFILGQEIKRQLIFCFVGLAIYFGLTHLLLHLGVSMLIMKCLIGLFLALILGGRYGFH